YYREQGARYTPSIAQAGGRGGPIDFTEVQKFYRLFRIPAAGHCGTAGGPVFPAPLEWGGKGGAPTPIYTAAKDREGPPHLPHTPNPIFYGPRPTRAPPHLHRHRRHPAQKNQQ